MTVDDCARAAKVDRSEKERAAFGWAQRRIFRTRDDRPVQRERKHLRWLEPLFLHAAWRDDDVLAVANADTAAGPRCPAERVKGARQVADQTDRFAIC